MSLTLGISPKIKAQIARLKKSDNDAAVKIRKLYARGLRASDLEKEAFQITGRNVLVKGATATFKGFDNSIIRVDMQTENPMAEEKAKKKKAKPPTAKQLRARAKFVKMVKARAKAARAAKRAAGIKVKPKMRVAAPARKTAAKKRVTPKRKRNLDHPDAKHRVEVSRHWRSGGKESQWQRAHKAGQKQLFAMNPLTAAQAKQLRDEYFYLRGKGAKRTAAEKKRQVAIHKAILRYEKSITAKKNPSTAKGKALFKEFSGRPARKVSEAYAPKGSGAKGTLGAMGKLVKIKVKGRTALDFRPTKAILARDAKNQMYVLGKGYKLNLKGKRHNPTGFDDLGAIETIEYEATKTHLDGVPTIYVHKMGEEGGAKPHLLVNDEGLAIISGGDYTITERGIEN